MITLRWLVAALVALAAVVVPAAASAQTAGFSLNRFDPSDRGSDWFVLESLDYRGTNRLAIGIVADWAHEPLQLVDSNGNSVDPIIEDQVFAHFGASIVLVERLRLAVNFPLAVVSQGDTADLGGGVQLSADSGASPGDLRLGADVRLFGEYQGPISAALGLHVHVPTGDRAAFTGDENVRIVPRFLLAGDIGLFAYGARLGVDVRTLGEDVAGQPFGTEVTWAASAGARILDKKLLIGPELYGSTVVSDGGDGAFARRSTPLEVIFGGHYKVTPDWRVGLGAGPGLTRGIGSPKVRVVASIEWFPEPERREKPPPPPPDRDGDGILDQDDACPDTPGVEHDDPNKHGCPPPGDRDADGILDEDDACPDTPGVASDDPQKHGCPKGDRDGDGILDEDDACPDEPGVASDDPQKHGCPLPKDTDGDGIIDPEDDCPEEAGPASTTPGKNGCPKAKIEGKQIKILERVEFDTNKATIRPESEGVLTAVLEILKDNPQIKKVSVEGHTDSRGGRGYNVGLSRRRAAAVVTWLVEKGVARDRLDSQGFGPDKPIDTNNTAEGRQNNRRVEFHIKKVEGKLNTEIEKR